MINKICGEEGAFNKRHRFTLTQWEISSRIYYDYDGKTCMNCGHKKTVSPVKIMRLTND